jgi:hypothetical protein
VKTECSTVFRQVVASTERARNRPTHMTSVKLSIAQLEWLRARAPGAVSTEIRRCIDAVREAELS